MVCSQAVEPLHEIKVGNAKEYQLRLFADGKLVIKFYPERFCIADEDLLDKVTRMYQRSEEKVIKQSRKFHLGLIERVRNAISKSKIWQF